MSAEADRWWRRRNDTAWPRADRMKEAGDALAAALEAAEVEKAHLTKVATEYQSRVAELETGLPRPTLAWLRGVMETIADHGHELQTPPGVGSRARGHASAIVAWLDLLAGRAAGGER